MPADIYKSLKFVFKIDFIGVDYDVQDELRDGGGNWIPPTHPGAITTRATTGWVRWTASNMSRATNIGSSDVQVCSLFYNSEIFSFLGVPYDCRTTSVQQNLDASGLGWRRLMFSYTDHYPPLSVIGFDLTHHVLAARGSDNWMPELVPPTYNHNQAQLTGVVSDRTSLAGDLSILIGMAGLSSASTRNPGDMIPHILNVLAVCFKPPQWRRHRHPTGRCHASGVVVSVRVDPTAPGMSATTLARFQSGEFGPIIDG